MAQTIKILDRNELVPTIWYEPKQAETMLNSSPRKLIYGTRIYSLIQQINLPVYFCEQGFIKTHRYPLVFELHILMAELGS